MTLEPDVTKTKAAWSAFVREGKPPSADVREPIARAWKRCQELGVDPFAMAASKLPVAETAELIARNRELIDSAAPYLRALALASGNERYAAMLSDETGLVLEIVADEETAYRTPGFPTPGTLLCEKMAGANGIGTALAEGQYVELVGPEHFIEGFQIYTCQGVPLKAKNGTIVGVISVSVRRIEAAERVHEILVCAAHGIEAELVHRRLNREVSELLQNLDSGNLPLEELRQDVIQLQTAARLRLELAARITHNNAEGALELVALAQQLISRFGRQSELWRDIAFADVSMPQPVDLQLRLRDVAELVATEAAIRGVRTRVQEAPPVHISTDSRELSRMVLRGFLRGFDSVKSGGELEAKVEIALDLGQACLSFSAPAGTLLLFPLAIEKEVLRPSGRQAAH